VEEQVGRLWDRFITRRAQTGHAQAAVSLAELQRTVAVYFRALGGDAAVRLAPAAERATGARRRWLARLAGSGERTAVATLGEDALRLPPQLAVFPRRELNRDLYLWLAALAAHQPAAGASWIAANQAATRRALQRWPGLRPRYRRLVAATLAMRPRPTDLPPDEAAQERAVRAALRRPGAVQALPPLRRRGAHALAPVPLWLHAAEPASRAQRRSQEAGAGGARAPASAVRALPTAQATAPRAHSPFLVPFRAESLLSWADFLRVNRPSADTDDDDATGAAASIDRLALTETSAPAAAARVRFDLDLPAAAADDLALGDGLLLPEWDFRSRRLLPDYCRLQPMLARDSLPSALPPALRRTARRLRSQLAALAPARRWRSGEPDGSELDIEACVRLRTDRLLGRGAAGDRLYRAATRCERDLACLLLADLSLSTDAWLSNEHRVIDVIRDSLLLFGEALSATADSFAMYGFSSLKRSLVRYHVIKEFDEPLSAAVRGRIRALRPGYYTRLGAAIRQATCQLAGRSAALRLLLILTDGKPHDIDHYDGRYGIEDTRASVLEARRAGLRPFCVTIDHAGAGYLPHVFGHGGYVVLRKPEELPARLPLLYAQLTR
jgi:nitric oxide reductase NorD protein